MTLISRPHWTYDKRVSSPPTSISQWLEDQRKGLSSSEGTFSVHLPKAERLGGYPRLGLSDVPLLLMAAAVEGGAGYFRLHGTRNCRFSWDGQAGPTLDLALSVLRHQRIDHEVVQRQGLELPEAFRDFLDPLFRRCRHAPLSMIVGNRVMWSNAPGQGVWVASSTLPRLSLVDRGVDFELPFAFPNLRVVARVGSPLLGRPWPLSLVWNEELRSLVEDLGESLNQGGLAQAAELAI